MSKNVLVADDDRSTRMLVVKALQAAGVSGPVEAADGDEALRRFLEGDFDLVVTDWDMPGKTGLELLHAVRAHDDAVPVVMVTVEAKADRVKEAVAAGVSDYLVKPFDQETLRERLGSFCKGVRSEFNSAVCRCRNVMNPNVITIRADATVGEAIERVLEHGISGLPVVDDHDRLIGIITEFELVRAISRPSMKRQSVRKFMSKNIVTVKEDTIPLEVVNLMEKHRIRRVPVVRNNYVVGIISRRDILRYVTENEDALREFLDTLRATAGAG